MRSLIVLTAFLATTSPARAAEIGEQADFRGYHLFHLVTPQPGDPTPRLVLSRSIPEDQLRGVFRRDGKIVMATAAEPGGIASDAYLTQHGYGPQVLNEVLQLGGMQPWGAPQVNAARFQAIRTVARRGYLPRSYAEHALTHYARALGLEVSFGKPFGKVERPAACASCGQHVPRRR